MFGKEDEKMFEEELEALMAIYCMPGECTIYGKEITLKFDTRAIQKGVCQSARRETTVIINIGADYPNTVPDFSVISEDIKRETIADLKAEVNAACKDLVGQPMLVAMVTAIQNCIEKEKTAPASLTSVQNDIECEKTSESSRDGTWMTLLHIDHMRSKAKYCKTLEKWTDDLNLKGRLLFCRRLILLVLQGDILSTKDFIVRLKTASIDVDSRGHSCKEKMMSVIAEEQRHSSERNDYQTLELSSLSELETVFRDAGLGDMYKKYVTNLKG